MPAGRRVGNVWITDLPPGREPSLVIVGGDGTSERWTRKARQHYRCWYSWLMYHGGRGCQLLRVDLTTAPGGSRKRLREDFKELRKRARRKYGYLVEYACVDTGEGNGVLHMVWAIKASGAVWVSQSWLSAQWEDIHGARVVWLKRISSTRADHRRVAHYLVQRYLSAQQQAGRFTYSWHRMRVALGSCWRELRREYSRMTTTSTWLGLNPYLSSVCFDELLGCWDALLERGRGVLGEVEYALYKRHLRVWGAAPCLPF